MHIVFRNAKEVKELIKDFLNERGLELSDEKTLITHIDNGFDFLGWNFRKYNGKLLVKPSKKSSEIFQVKIRQIHVIIQEMYLF
jgi:RNA-directed DNA polymerase